MTVIVSLVYHALGVCDYRLGGKLNTSNNVIILWNLSQVSWGLSFRRMVGKKNKRPYSLAGVPANAGRLQTHALANRFVQCSMLAELPTILATAGVAA